MSILAAVRLPLPGLKRPAPALRLPPVALALALFAAVWLGEIARTNLTPPADDLEQLTWVRSLAFGYPKHPPLPTWLLWPFARLGGYSEWTVYLVGAAVTLAGLATMHALLRELRGPRHAAVALAAVCCVTYYNGRLHYHNHNTVLMLVTAVAAWTTWRAHVDGRRRWWALLGLTFGLGVLTKYQVALTGLSLLAFLACTRAWRDPASMRGLALAAAIASVVALPHAIWLVEHDFQPLHYANASSLGHHLGPAQRLQGALAWMADQGLGRALGAWLLLAGLACWSRRSEPTATQPPATPTRAGTWLLLCWGVLPLLAMPLISLLSGAHLQPHWGTAWMVFFVPAVMELAGPARWGRIPASVLWPALLAMQGLLLLQSELTSSHGPAALRTHHWRDLDSAALAAAIAPEARRQLGGPVQIVAGPARFAAALALRLPEKPRVLVDDDLALSPWIGANELHCSGVVRLGPSPELAAGQAVGPALPGWSWQAVAPRSGCAHVGSPPTMEGMTP